MYSNKLEEKIYNLKCRFNIRKLQNQKSFSMSQEKKCYVKNITLYVGHTGETLTQFTSRPNKHCYAT